jgi:hypothetical protein
MLTPVGESSRGKQQTSELQDFKRLHNRDFKFPQNFKRLPKTSKDFKRLQGTSKDFKGLHETSKDFTGLHGLRETS